MPLRPNVLILEVHRLGADLLHRQVLGVAPEASCTVVSRMSDARRDLEARAFDLVLTGTRAPDGDILDLLFLLQWQRPRPWASVLVVTPCCGARLTVSFRHLGVGGIFDLENDTTDNLPRAIEAVLLMREYWSESARRTLLCPTPDELRLRLLTATEQLVLGAIGDGSRDDAVSSLLNMTISTVQSHRRNIYSALRLRDRWDLVCAAEKFGFTRFVRGGCVRLGFSLLLHAYQTNTQRPQPLSATLRTAYPELVAHWESRRRPRKVPQELALNLG